MLASCYFQFFTLFQDQVVCDDFSLFSWLSPYIDGLVPKLWTCIANDRQARYLADAGSSVADTYCG